MVLIKIIKILVLAFPSRSACLLSGALLSVILSSTIAEVSYAMPEISNDALTTSYTKQRVVNPQGPVREPFRREVDLSVEPVFFPSLNILVGVEEGTGRPLVVRAHPFNTYCTEFAVGDVIAGVMDGNAPWRGIRPDTRAYRIRTLDELERAIQAFSSGDEVTIAFFRGEREDGPSVRYTTRILRLSSICEPYWDTNL